MTDEEHDAPIFLEHVGSPIVSALRSPCQTLPCENLYEDKESCCVFCPHRIQYLRRLKRIDTRFYGMYVKMTTA